MSDTEKTLFDQFNKNLLSVSGYIPSPPMDLAQNSKAENAIIKLDSNENPCPPSESIQNLNDYLDMMRYYPDSDATQLKNVLAKNYSVTPDMLTVGNGSDNVMEIAFRAMLEKDDEVILSEFSFPTADLLTHLSRAIIKRVSTKNWHHDLEGFLNAVTEKTKLVYLENPQNPTGTFIASKEFGVFLNALPKHILVVIDEAYIEYVDHALDSDNIKFLRQHDNLLLIRTFSKFFGLAGLRIGYGISHPKLISYLNKLRLPFNVNSLGLIVASKVAQDENYKRKIYEQNLQVRQLFQLGLQNLNIKFISSQANFVTMHLEKIPCVIDRFKELNISVRPLKGGLSGWVRITIGLADQMKFILSALEKFTSIAA